jgi:putative membrane protein
VAVLAAAADTSFSWAPGPLALSAVLAIVYGRRWHRVRTQAGVRAASPWRLIALAGALLTLLVALVSPVDALGEQLFAMHMVQHVLVLDFAPVLLMLSLTKTLLRPVTRRMQVVERRAGVLAHPAFAVVAYVATMFFWHVPALYDAALENSTIHIVEHMSFLSVGCLYWWHLLSPIRSRISIGPFGPVIYMLVTKLLVSFLGIAITFAPDSLYPFYENAQPVWGLDAATDQSLAGAIMAVEQSVVMGVALAFLFVKALGDSERADERAERFDTAV